MSGFGLLFSGALGLLYISGISSAINVTQFFGFLFSYLLPWFANVFFIIGLSAILWKKFTVSLVLSVLSTLVSIRVFFTGVPTTLMQSGTFDPSLSPPNFGFYLWFGSFILLAIYSLRQSLLQEKKV